MKKSKIPLIKKRGFIIEKGVNYNESLKNISQKRNNSLKNHEIVSAALLKFLKKVKHNRISSLKL